MGRFSVSTASLVLLYKGSPTCPVMASRVSCLLVSLPLSQSIGFLPSTSCHGDSSLSIRLSDLAAEAALYHLHLYHTRLHATVATV
jgi:hypothetical protein